MFMIRLKQYLTQPEDLGILLEFGIIDAGLLAISIIFLPYLLSIEKPDQSQTGSLVLFCIAIPLLAFHLYFTQTLGKTKLPVSAYLVKFFGASFVIGPLCAYFGIVAALNHFSIAISIVFSVSCFIVCTLAVLIYKDRANTVQRMIDMERDTTTKTSNEGEK